MKKQHFISGILSLLFAITFSLYGQIDTVTILSLNDTHSNLAPLAPRGADLQGTRGGIARAATIIGTTRLTEKNVLLLHAGDSFIGDISFNYSYGTAELSLLKALQFDAITLGNHEFDLNPSTLKGAIDASMGAEPIPFLSANAILDCDTNYLSYYVHPYVIKQAGNSKIGLIGLTTPEANELSSPSPIILDTNLVVITADAIDSLKAAGCRAIILLSHLGLELDKLLASYLPGINLIISGHDHYLLSQPVYVTDPAGKSVPIIQSDAFYTCIGNTKLAISPAEVKLISFNNIPLDSSVPEEPTVKGMVDNLITSIEGIYGHVFTGQIGFATEDFEEVPTDLFATGSHETAIGNLVSDAFRWKTGTQIAIEPGGSTAQKLFKGPIVPADVFRVVGYGFNIVNGLGFRLVTFKLTGIELWTAFEKTISMLTYSDEFLPQVSGIKYSFNINNRPGERLQQMLINGAPVNFDSTYSITSNELLVLIMSNPLFDIKMSDVNILQDQTEFQVLTEYISTHSPLIPRRDGSVLATPVELVAFTARQTGTNVVLAWSTKTETNNRGFEIEKKSPSAGWIKIGYIQGHGTTSNENKYTFTDALTQNQNQLFCYRLKQIDYDGTFTYSKEIKTEFTIVKTYQLFQNYPNPFNPSTKIKFFMPETGRASLIIYNALGQQVARLLDKDMEAGVNTIQWKADGFTSGFYICELKCGSFKNSIKLLLIK